MLTRAQQVKVPPPEAVALCSHLEGALLFAVSQRLVFLLFDSPFESLTMRLTRKYI